VYEHLYGMAHNLLDKTSKINIPTRLERAVSIYRVFQNDLFNGIPNVTGVMSVTKTFTLQKGRDFQEGQHVGK
jgi:hypothetical protein